MKIRTKLLVGFLLVVAFLVASSIIAYVGLTRMAAAIRAVNAAIVSVNKEATTAMQALEIQSSIADATAPARRYVLNGDRRAEEEFTERAAEVESEIAEMRAMDLAADAESQLEYLARQWSEQHEDLTAILAIPDPVGNPIAAASLSKVEATSSLLRRHSVDVVGDTQERLLQTRQDADTTSQEANAIVGSTLRWLVIVAVLALAHDTLELQ